MAAVQGISASRSATRELRRSTRMNAPRVGGSFAVWGGLFSVFDCSCVYIRQMEDPWNSIIVDAATGGFLQMQQGLRASARSAAFGGILLALIEGAGIMLNKMMSAPQNMPIMFEDPQMPQTHKSYRSELDLEISLFPIGSAVGLAEETTTPIPTRHRF